MLFKEIPLTNKMCSFRALHKIRWHRKRYPSTDVQQRLDCLLKFFFFHEIFWKPHYSFITKFASKLNLTISHIYEHHKNEYLWLTKSTHTYMICITKMNIFDLENLQVLWLNWTGTPHSCKDKNIFLNTICQAFYILQR